MMHATTVERWSQSNKYGPYPFVVADDLEFHRALREEIHRDVAMLKQVYPYVCGLWLCPMAACKIVPAFTILENPSAAAGLHVIGPRMARRRGAPSEASLLRQLAAERRRHRELKTLVSEMDVPPTCYWKGPELAAAKRRRLRAKTHVQQLVSTLRQVRESEPWQLGEGSFGRVLLGRQAGSGELVALKVIPHGSGDGNDTLAVAQLRTEAEVLALMTERREPGFPRLLHCATQDVAGRSSLVLAMELLGPNIDDLWWEATGGTSFSVASTLRIGRQMLARLQHLHSAGFVHNDVSPRNFCMGRGHDAVEAAVGVKSEDRTSVVHLVDFGSATPVCGQLMTDEFRGTWLFAGAPSHTGGLPRACTPADDIASLVNCLIYLGSGSLPWEHSSSEAESEAAKKTVMAEQLTSLLPEALGGPVGRLWQLARQAHRSPLINIHEYAYDADWPTACRAALGADVMPCGSNAPNYDWEEVGITWSASGEIMHAR